MGSDEKQPDTKELRERFVRWQSVTREQLSYAINLILAFAGTTIGFEITLLLNRKFTLASGVERFFFLLSLLLLALSMLPGLLAVVTRLGDFRLTTRIAKLERHNGGHQTEIQKLRICTDKLGKLSWRLFWGQIAMFASGVAVAAGVLFTFAATLLF